MGSEDLQLRVSELRRAERLVLREVELVARRAEVLALVGKNGAGKSTLLRAMAGLVPLSGVVRVAGRDLSRLTPRQRARLVAYVPQRSQLTAPLLVEDVVRQGYFGRPSGAPVALERHLSDARALDLAGRPFTSLSVGEQQRVLLARALATGAPWLLFDEPTAALDVAEGLALLQLVRELARRGCGVVVVLHSLNEVLESADRVALLADGAIVRQGPPRQVLAPDEVRRTYGVQILEGAAAGFCLLGAPEGA